MEINSINTEPTTHITREIIRCGICRNEINNAASIYQEGLTFGVVCEQCYKHNSPEDLEMIANLFLAYGGYFGKLRNKKFSIHRTIKKLIAEYQKNTKTDLLIEMNIKMMHQALLYGINPQELIQGLKIFVILKKSNKVILCITYTNHAKDFPLFLIDFYFITLL